MPDQTVMLTAGQEAMDVDFNGGREDIKTLKLAFAAAYDAIDAATDALPKATDTSSALRNGKIGRLAAVSKTHLETACMYAVKAITRK